MSVLLEEAFDPPAGPSSYQEISPVPSFQLRRAVGGIETEVLVQTFGDRVLVVVTQNGKMGVVTQASLPASIPLPVPPRSAPSASPTRLAAYPPPPPALRLTPLLGTAPAYPSPEVYATYTAQIATLVFWTLHECQLARRPVVVSLALDRGARAHRSEAEEEGEGAGEEGEEEMEMEMERTRFGGIMDMVTAWPGV